MTELGGVTITPVTVTPELLPTVALV